MWRYRVQSRITVLKIVVYLHWGRYYSILPCPLEYNKHLSFFFYSFLCTTIWDQNVNSWAEKDAHAVHSNCYYVYYWTLTTNGDSWIPQKTWKCKLICLSYVYLQGRYYHLKPYRKIDARVRERAFTGAILGKSALTCLCVSPHHRRCQTERRDSSSILLRDRLTTENDR